MLHASYPYQHGPRNGKTYKETIHIPNISGAVPSIQEHHSMMISAQAQQLRTPCTSTLPTPADSDQRGRCNCSEWIWHIWYLLWLRVNQPSRPATHFHNIYFAGQMVGKDTVVRAPGPSAGHEMRPFWSMSKIDIRRCGSCYIWICRAMRPHSRFSTGSESQSTPRTLAW